MSRIGIAITTKDRKSVFTRSYKFIKKFAPKDAIIVVVDDGSSRPIREATFRFNESVGIATAKNKCIDLLMEAGCEHLFLFDDDCYPIRRNWDKIYTQSGVKHLSFTFDKLRSGKANARNKILETENLNVFESPCGCMLYFHRSVVETIGGFNPDFVIWGQEHVEYSNRAYNAGLTPYRFCDVKNSLEYFISRDQRERVISSTPGKHKYQCLQNNQKLFKRIQKSADYIPVKSKTDGIILAAYFNYSKDPQRKTTWEANNLALEPLIKSCRKLNLTLKIFTNCFEENDTFIKVPGSKKHTPSNYRWLIYYEWLKKNKYDNVFMVDSTDVIVQKNPFLSLNPYSIYSGDEEQTLDCEWLITTQEPFITFPDYKDVIEPMRKETLLNCGIVGGNYEIVMNYLEHRCRLHQKYTKDVTASTDMATHNYIMRKYFNKIVIHGLKVNTRFKYNERNNISFFKHK